MTTTSHALTITTVSTGFGGAILAQSTQSPTITVGALLLSFIGLVSLYVRERYQTERVRLTESARADATRYELERVKAEVEVYRRDRRDDRDDRNARDERASLSNAPTTPTKGPTP